MTQLGAVSTRIGEMEGFVKDVERKPKCRWIEIGSDVTEEQKEVIDRLSLKLSKRCMAVLKQVICFDPERWGLEEMLAIWAKIMKPRRTDWLLVLKKLKELDHPLYFEVAELALLEESFEPHIRDYTKIIHGYGKANRLQDAENMLSVMNSRGFNCDQISLTAMIDMYSKADNLRRAEETFNKIKLLGEPLDNRTYGSMIMAYVRAGMLEQGEYLLKEMDAQEIRAGSEIYKALLRAYSVRGDTEGAQRVFDAIQIASITPDVKICGLLINAYGLARKSHMARIAFENMRRAGLEPNDKCVALVLSAYKKDNKLNDALGFLIELEKEGVIIGKEASETLAGWFGELGVAKEVELILKEYITSEEVPCHDSVTIDASRTNDDRAEDTVWLKSSPKSGKMSQECHQREVVSRKEPPRKCSLVTPTNQKKVASQPRITKKVNCMAWYSPTSCIILGQTRPLHYHQFCYILP
ncbi:unnamed protein product [Rhodiola kirilowii]